MQDDRRTYVLIKLIFVIIVVKAGSAYCIQHKTNIFFLFVVMNALYVL